MIAASSAEAGRPEITVAEATAISFADLYASEHDRLVRVAALLVGSTAAAEDLVQEAFAKLHPRLARVDNPAAWLRTVVVNGSKNELRRFSVRRRYLAAHGPTTDVTHRDTATHDLIDLLRTLPTRQRAVIVLRFYEDRTEADIASILGIRPGTVKSSLHRALATLRQEIHDE